MALKNLNAWLSIANAALARINQTAISSLEDGSATAADINLMLSSVVTSVLQENDWKCARKRIRTAPLAKTPAFGFSSQFQLPSDFVRLYRVDNAKQWEREGDVILADAEYLDLIYIAMPSDPSSLDPLLIDAISARLTARLATRITSDTSLASYFESLANSQITKAKRTEGAGMEDIPLGFPEYNDDDMEVSF